MSAILDIYATLAAQPVTASGITPAVYNLDKLPSMAQGAILPCRLLTIFPSRAQSQGKLFLTFAGNRQIDWLITDLLLWRGVSSGIGLEDIAAVLMEYMGAYLHILPMLRSSKWQVTNIQAQPDTINWPDGSDSYFHGVRTLLTVHEILD